MRARNDRAKKRMMIVLNAKPESFFGAIESQQVEIVRQSLVYGGLLLSSCNDKGETGIMRAALLGKEKSLRTILEVVRFIKSAVERSEALDALDGDGKTPLMMAAAGGRLECVKLLMAAKANLNLTDEEGYTARGRAVWAGKTNVVDVLDGKKEDSSASEEEVDSDGGFYAETTAERRKRKKLEKGGGGRSLTTLSAMRNAKAADIGVAEEAPDQAEKEATVLDSSTPVLQEIVDALSAAAFSEKTSGAVKELKMSLIRTDVEQAPGLTVGGMDPALWRCGPNIRHLEIRWRPGLAAGSLDRINVLKRILHLAVQDCRLPALPETLPELPELRSLEVDGNNLITFPNSFGDLAKTLESLSAARNKLTSECLEMLAPLNHLTSLKLDHNQISELDKLSLNEKPHLVTLSVAHNALTEIPDDPWSDLVLLQHLNLSANKLIELPCEMGAMKEKKLTELVLHDNPWKDGKIRNMIENSAVLSNTVLTYLRKQKPQKKPKKNAHRRGAKQNSDSDAGSEGALREKANDSGSEHEEAPSIKKGKKKGMRLKQKPIQAVGEVQTNPVEDPVAEDSEDDESRLARLAVLEEARKVELEEKRVAAVLKKAQKERLELAMQQKSAAADHARSLCQRNKYERDARKAGLAVKREQEKAEEEERRSKMTVEEIREEDEQKEADREEREQYLEERNDILEQQRKAKGEVQAEQNRLKLVQRKLELKIDEAKFKFVWYGGQMHKVLIHGNGRYAHTANAMGGTHAMVTNGMVGNKTAGGGGGASDAAAKQNSGGQTVKKGGGQRGGGRQDTMNFEGSIDVPQELVGLLIGKGGSTIKELCISTGAYISLPKDTKTDVLQVEIRGGKQAVNSAVERIAQLLMASRSPSPPPELHEWVSRSEGPEPNTGARTKHRSRSEGPASHTVPKTVLQSTVPESRGP